jgi:predicted acetyltransferase
MTISPAGLQIRTIESLEERRQAFALFRQAMLGIGDIGRTDPDAEARYLGDGQLFGAFDGAVLLGTVNGFDSGIAVPGGKRLRHLGVTHVGVAPQATRRGVARQLLVTQLRHARAAGYAVAGLRASDARIYERYGYGVASWSVRHELDLTRTELAVGTPREELRPVDATESFPLFRRIVDSEPSPRAATVTRWEGWWTIQAFRTRHGATPHHAVVFGAEGSERGYLRFHTEASDNWFASQSRTIIVDDLVAHDGEAWRALIGHLFAQDILHRAIFPSRPVDDPLPLLLKDPRALTVSGLRDESWVRPLDLETLLAARPLAHGRPVVIEVQDPILPENSGRWLLGDGHPARSNRPADARLAIGDLGVLIFGAYTPAALDAAGRLQGTSAETIAALEDLFHVGRKPHSGITF